MTHLQNRNILIKKIHHICKNKSKFYILELKFLFARLQNKGFYL